MRARAVNSGVCSREKIHKWSKQQEGVLLLCNTSVKILIKTYVNGLLIKYFIILNTFKNPSE